jgi:outer membrane protein assembly factor BamA
VRRAGGVNLVVTRTLGRGTPLSLGYRPQRVRLSAAESFFCASFLVCRPEDVGLLQGSNFLSPVSLSLSRDQTDRAFNPTRGYRFVADVEHASSATGSTFAYERAVAEVVSFRETFGDAVLALRVRGGWVGPRAFQELRDQEGVDARVVHPQKRFFAGGANSVRGYAQNQLGPRVLTVPVDALITDREDEGPVCTPESVLDLTCDASALDDREFTVIPSGGSALLEGSLELRFRVWGENIHGAAFMDLGQVWSAGQDVDLGDVVFTPGLGVRYQTPVGPIRVDLGYRGLRPQRLSVITAVGALSDELEPGQLAVLEPQVLFGEDDRFRRRLQFHLSIGHAF